MSSENPSLFLVEETPFIEAIRQAPTNLNLHLDYADWLSEKGFDSRADVLRAWVVFMQVPCPDAGFTEIDAVYRTYQNSLLQKDADWIYAIDAVRKWINPTLATKILHIFIGDVFGKVPMKTWLVKVNRCIFDDRWSGDYEGDLLIEGQPQKRTGTFYINPITGTGSGHVGSQIIDPNGGKGED